MVWYEVPETYEEEKVNREIAECKHRIDEIQQALKAMRLPQREWKNNIMIKAYLKRIEKARLILKG